MKVTKQLARVEHTVEYGDVVEIEHEIYLVRRNSDGDKEQRPVILIPLSTHGNTWFYISLEALDKHVREKDGRIYSQHMYELVLRENALYRER